LRPVVETGTPTHTQNTAVTVCTVTGTHGSDDKCDAHLGNNLCN